MGIRGALLNVFSKSPFKLICSHMEKSVQSVNLLELFFQQVHAQQWDKAKVTQSNIAALESEADKLQKTVGRHLHSDMFLPVSRFMICFRL